LMVVRVVLWAAGAAAIGWGVWKLFFETSNVGLISFSNLLDGEYSDDRELTGEELRVITSKARELGLIESAAAQFVWFCPGIPLVLPADTFFTRRRWWLLGASAALWFAPMLLDDDSPYGYLLRMFATLSAFLTLFVWRSLWKLTKPFGGGTEPGSTSPLS